MRILAQNLHAASASVARAIRQGDRDFLGGLARRLDAIAVDALDLGVSAVTSSRQEEIERLSWLAEVVASVSATPLFLDSPHSAVLCAVARAGDPAWGINSLRDPEALPPEQWEVIRRSTGPVVLQLVAGGRLPEGVDDRLRLAARRLEAARARGLEPERAWIDPVCLPWGADVEAGRGLLDFLEESARRWPGHPSVVGLSNVSWGHEGRRRLHRQWLRRLADRGLGAVILDPLEPGLLEVLRASPGER